LDITERNNPEAEGKCITKKFVIYTSRQMLIWRRSYTENVTHMGKKTPRLPRSRWEDNIKMDGNVMG
jgi:bisphosphoglycerate-dependent phosphoglycerate mutase